MANSILSTANLTNLENISLAREIALIAPTDTPFSTLLLANKRFTKANGTVHTWREKTLDTTADITVAEGADASNFANSTRAELSNMLELFMKSTSITGTAQSLNITGVGDLFSSEIADRLTELKINLEKKLISGTKDDGSVTGIRKMAGLASWVHNDNKIAGAELNKITNDEVIQLAEKLWNQGVSTGNLYAMVNSSLKKQINGIYSDVYSYVAKTNDFGLVVNAVETDFGTISFVLNRHMPADKIFCFDLNALAIAFLRQPFFEMLAKTGDKISGQVITEATLKVASTKAVAEYTLKTE